MDDIEFYTTVTAEQEWLEDEKAQIEYRMFLDARDEERRKKVMQAVIENREIK